MRVSGPQYMYHVAPASVRDSIYANGLTGHERDSVKSPWTQQVGQPPGNYMFETPEMAKAYVAGLAARMSPKKHMYPGDLDSYDYIDHGVYPDFMGSEHASVDARKKPDRFNDWSDQAQDDWREEQGYLPYNHHDPAHRNLLPPNLQGYDVWQTQVNGLPMTIDPEDYLEIKQYNQKMRPDLPNPFLSPDDIDVDDDDNYNSGWPRWMTHEHVPADRLRLHQHYPGYQINDDFADEAHGDAEPHMIDDRIPLIHPRHILPKGLPPEARKYWSRRLREAARRHREGLRGANPMDLPIVSSEGLKTADLDWHL